MKSRELRCTWCKDSWLAATFSELRQSSLAFINKWSPELDTSETPTRNLISQNSHLVKSCKPLGMENLFSLEDWHYQKLRKRTHSQIQHFSISNQLLHCQMQETHKFSCALLFALTWVASPFLISEPIKVGFASAMVQSTINSEESDKDQLKLTYPISTTQSTDLLSALRSKSSPMNHLSSSMSEALSSKDSTFAL